ncbi:MAG: DUF3047 domain-containing protein [Alphaproteobacteria bacterium]|nr:DUF3047 domain-containing protein [Alphaproteobacteria bacterium]
MRWITAFCAGLVLLPLPAAATTAACLTTGPSLEQAGWEHLTYPHLKEIDFDRSQEGAIMVHAERATSILGIEAPVGLAWLSWSWRVDKPAPPTDLTARGQDDRSLMVHVWVPFEASMELTLTPGLDGDGRLLTYVWGGTQDKGALIRNPYMTYNGALIVLQPAGSPVGTWIEEVVDWRADYQRAFGEAAPQTVPAIGLSADTDDTGSLSFGQIRDICFQSDAPAASEP